MLLKRTRMAFRSSVAISISAAMILFLNISVPFWAFAILSFHLYRRSQKVFYYNCCEKFAETMEKASLFILSRPQRQRPHLRRYPSPQAQSKRITTPIRNSRDLARPIIPRNFLYIFRIRANRSLLMLRMFSQLEPNNRKCLTCFGCQTLR